MPEGVASPHVQKLANYFQDRSDVAVAFLYGSHARGTPTRLSDVDVAVYFTPLDGSLDYQSEAELAGKKQVRRHVSVEALSAVPEFSSLDTKEIAAWTRPRNLLAHECLDVRWRSLERFRGEAVLQAAALIAASREYLRRIAGGAHGR